MKRVLLALLLLAGCKGIPDRTPTEPQETVDPGPPQTIVVTPVEIPSPTTGGTPAPTPPPGTPGPAPTATPRPPTSSGCSLPPGNGEGHDCRPTGATFAGDVESALDQVIAQHPEYFDLSRRACSNCPLIVNGRAFESAVIAALASRGVCAVGGEEFGLKNSNAFNDQFDLVTADSFVRRGSGAYRGTCVPAAF